jgi:hypothetical protein
MCYNNQVGVALANEQRRYNLRAYVDQKIRSWLKI